MNSLIVECASENMLEGRKEILLMRAITEVDWHVNVWFEQINGPQIYQENMLA